MSISYPIYTLLYRFLSHLGRNILQCLISTDDRKYLLVIKQIYLIPASAILAVKRPLYLIITDNVKMPAAASKHLCRIQMLGKKGIEHLLQLQCFSSAI